MAFVMRLTKTVTKFVVGLMKFVVKLTKFVMRLTKTNEVSSQVNKGLNVIIIGDDTKMDLSLGP